MHRRLRGSWFLIAALVLALSAGPGMVSAHDIDELHMHDRFLYSYRVQAWNGCYLHKWYAHEGYIHHFYVLTGGRWVPTGDPEDYAGYWGDIDRVSWDGFRC